MLVEVPGNYCTAEILSKISKDRMQQKIHGAATCKVVSLDSVKGDQRYLPETLGLQGYCNGPGTPGETLTLFDRKVPTPRY